jgi:hypothetical protein
MKNKFKIIGTLIIVLVFTLGLVPLNVVLAASPTIVSITIPAKVTPGEQFTIDINVEPGTAIAGMQFNLTFDSSVVTTESVVEGNLLNHGGASTYFSPGTINNEAGTIIGVAGAITTPGQSVNTRGTFAIITMTASTEGGASPLTLSEVIVGDINGQAVDVNVESGEIAINRAPILSEIGSKSSNEGYLLSFSIFASDADNDELVYSVSSLPDGATFNTETHTFSWTPRYDQAGVYTVHFEVSDGDLTDYEDVTITINQLHDNWDVNGDGKANALDMVLVGQQWEETGLTGWIPEDTNEDGAINVLDMIVIGQHWTGQET